MHVRVRLCGKPEGIVVVPSKLTKIETFRKLLEDKFGLEPSLQRLFYGGKLLEDGYSFHDYNIKLNDVIQLMQKVAPPPEPQEKKDDSTGKEKEVLAEPSIQYEDATSKLYRIGDLIDVREKVHNAWFEGKVVQIVKDPEYVDETKPETNKSNVNGHMKDEKVSNSNETSCTKSPNKDSPKENTPVKEKETKKSSPVKENGLNNSINGHSSKTDSPKSCDSPKNRTTPKRGIKDYFSKEKVNGDVETGKGTKGKEEEKYNAQDKSEQIEKDSSGSENVNGKCDKMDVDNSDEIDEDFGLLYKIHFDEEEEGSAQYCKLSEIRPRARKEIKVEHLEVGQTVMLNYNTEESHEKGYWYDFTIQEIKKLRKNVELIGTLYHGKDIPLNDVKVKIHDKMFAIETVVPLSKRTGAYDKLMITPIEKRAGPLLCTKCRDDPETPCKDCGCNICAGKNLPDQIILCDECNQGFHMSCLTPPLEGIPEEDWYCSECKRDTNSVVAPGAKKQTRKPNQRQGRDWGRGMACVGKTQTCAMPANHFGPIPGIEVGMAWRFRIQLSESGVHRPPVSGIHGRDVEGAYSIVLSGGYEDDVDNGFEFTYTGSGGRDLSGNKRTADQSSDQTLTRENKALARNCAVKEVNEEGADSKDKWREGRPVRVVRSYKMFKHFPEYAPKEGIRFDGIYKVVKYYPEKGKSGFRVWKYLLRRDDPNPAPWEKNGKTFPIVYPDGYLEAEAEKQAQKERQKSKGQKSPAKKTARKRPLRESNGNSKDDYSDDESDKKRKSKSGKESPPAKKMRTRSSLGTEKTEEKSKKINTPKRKATDKSNEKISSPSNANNPFTIAASKKSKVSNGANDSQSENASLEVLSAEDREGLEKDTVNKKLWDECLEALKKDGRKGLVDKVTSLFLCIICQEVAASPVTTNCSHNFCMACLKLAFQNTESNCCPYCRADLSKDEMNYNENLKTALRAVLPGYDLRRK